MMYLLTTLIIGAIYKGEEFIHRHPHEEWREYVRRLELARLAVLAEQKEREAQALDYIAQSTKDDADRHISRVAARAKRSASQEFRDAMEHIIGGKKPDES